MAMGLNPIAARSTASRHPRGVRALLDPHHGHADGLLERCHAYKDKIAQGLSADHGLFAYPVLQAADILIVRADLVPVGKDQKQHVEVARDIAQRFNATYGAVLSNPEPYIPDDVATVPGTRRAQDEQVLRQHIELFAPERKVRSQIMAIVTDSKSVDEPKDPTTCNVFGIFQLFLNATSGASGRLATAPVGMGYGDVKKALFERFLDYFGPMRRRREELERHPTRSSRHCARARARCARSGCHSSDEVRDRVGIPPRADAHSRFTRFGSRAARARVRPAARNAVAHSRNATSSPCFFPPRRWCKARTRRGASRRCR
jgi:hypothetical protein